MADPRFFKNHGPFTLSDLAALAGGVLQDASQGEFSVADVASLEEADGTHISFLDNIRYKEAFSATHAGACIVSEKLAPMAPKSCRVILSSHPYKSYALIAQAFYPSKQKQAEISPLAMIDETAEVGEGTRIDPGAVIGPGVKIGKDCWIGANTTVSHALIGDHVRLYPGVRVGQDGFGFAIDPAGHVKVPQLGRVIIEDNVEVGANSCIDRGAGPDTIIGAGTWIDNLVQIGHNVKIGRGCVLVAQSGIAGSSVMEDYSVLAAQAGVAGHLTIGKGARVGAQAGVMRDIGPGEEHLGSPSQPIRQHMRQLAFLKRLTKGQKSE